MSPGIIFDPIDELSWNLKREKVAALLDCMMSQMRTPGLRSELRRYVDSLMNRANHPTDYIQEAVEDARHDLCLLSGEKP